MKAKFWNTYEEIKRAYNHDVVILIKKVLVYAIDESKKDFIDKTAMIVCSVESETFKSACEILINADKDCKATHFMTKEEYKKRYIR